MDMQGEVEFIYCRSDSGRTDAYTYYGGIGSTYAYVNIPFGKFGCVLSP